MGIAGACTLDYLVALAVVCGSGGAVGYLRWSRPLRMLYLPFTDKSSANTVFSILDTLPSLGDLLLLGVACTFIFAILAVRLFTVEGSTLRGEPHGGDDSNSFDAFDLAFVSLLTLITGENFPRVLWPALSWSPLTILYFVTFVLVGTVIMMAIVALVFDFWRRFQALKVLEEKVIERQCLLMAFALVDEDSSGTISFGEFAQLCAAAQSRQSATDLLYNFLDADGDNRVSVGEFLRLSEVLLLEVKESTRRVTGCLSCVTWRSERAQGIVRHRFFSRVVLAALAVFAVRLALSSLPQVSGDIPEATLAAVDAFLLGILSLEALLKCMALSVRGYLGDGWNRMDLAVVVVSVGTAVVAFAANGTAFAAYLRVLRPLPLVALFSHYDKLRTLIQIFIQMRPMMVTISKVILSLLYIYLIIGLEAFSHRILWRNEVRERCGEWCPGFDNAIVGVVTLVQLVLSANWDELVHAMSTESRVLPWLFVISFVLLTNAILLSLLAALILEIYSVESERSMSRERLSALFPHEALDATGQNAVGAERYLVVLSNGVRALFDNYDEDRSGSISVVELSNLLADLGEPMGNDDLKQVLSSLDVDLNGQINFPEFLSWWQRHGLEKVFRKHDVDGNGTHGALREARTHLLIRRAIAPP